METIQKSYWNGTGLYQRELDFILKELVPPMGEAETVKGELVRCVNNLSYEYYNNGNCNAHNCTYDTDCCWDCDGYGVNEDGEDCFCCGGSGEMQYNFEGKIDDYYMGMVDYIRKNVPNVTPYIQDVETIIKTVYTDNKGKFSDENEAKYTALIDKVMEYVITL